MADRVIKPDAGNNLILANASGTTALKVDSGGGISSSSVFPAGHILQIQHSRNSEGYNTNSTSLTSSPGVVSNDMGSITPSSTSNTIFLMAYANVNPDSNVIMLDFRRHVSGEDAVENLSNETEGLAYTGNESYSGGMNVAYSIQDSPNTTSPVTYYITFRSADGGEVYVGRTNCDIQVTLFEIKR